MFTLQKWIEFTLNIGCPNNCLYCPQKTFIEKYFEEDKNRKKEMTLDDFKVLLQNIPKSVDIDFAGFGEPFVNPEAIDMMEYAAKKGYRVHIYSTLRTLTAEKLERLRKIKISSFIVHLPDEDGLINLNVDDNYIEILKKFISLNFVNTEFMVVGRLHHLIPDIIKQNLETTPIVTRGKNLDKSKFPPQVVFSEKEEINIPNSTKVLCNRRFHNKTKGDRPTCTETTILLPDGTMVLCCQDWSLKHQLGNLFKNTYLEIINNPIMKRIEDSMMCKNDDYLLCRNCEWAVIWNEEKWENFKKCGCYNYPSVKDSENNFVEQIFSVKNSINKTHKILTILGIKIKFKKK